MNQISITLNQEELNKIIDLLQQYEIASNNSTIMHLYKYSNATVTIYKTKVLVIQAKNAENVYKDIFGIDYVDNDNHLDLDDQDIKINQNHIATVGSDEVGTGDFFGGIVVCAAYVKPTQIEWLKNIGVKDSKLLSDEKMKEIYEQIQDKISYEVISLDPVTYNQSYDLYGNSNIIKAVTHNQAFWNLSKKIKRPYFVIIDQFANQSLYSRYIREANKTEYTIDIFQTKAESKYVAVACASIIARVCFLEQLNELSVLVNQKLLLGSSNEEIKLQAKNILEQQGHNQLKNICKNHFITYKEILGE